MNPDQSWMSVKHPDLLKEYQFLWDIQELYARKTRKIVRDLNNEKYMDVNPYREKIYQQVRILQREQNKYRGTIINQPDLYKILNNQYQDSLKIYSKYARRKSDSV